MNWPCEGVVGHVSGHSLGQLGFLEHLGPQKNGITSPCIFTGFCQLHQASVMEANMDAPWLPGCIWFLRQQGDLRRPDLSSCCGEGLTIANSLTQTSWPAPGLKTLRDEVRLILSSVSFSLLYLSLSPLLPLTSVSHFSWLVISFRGQKDFSERTR